MADGLFYVDSRAPHISADVPAVTLAGTNKALVPLANLPVLGQNYFGYVGKAVRLTMFGRMTTGATPGNGTFALLWGTGADANGTVIGSTTAVALVINGTNLSWRAEAIIRCRAMGVTGSLFVTGFMTYHLGLVAAANQPVTIPSATPAAVTVDLTAANFISPQYLRSGSTGESMQVHDFLFEVLN